MINHAVIADGHVFTLHGTVIVAFRNNTLVLNTGGYCTATTARHMNKALAHLGIGGKVSRSKGFMYFERNGRKYVIAGCATFYY